MMLLSTTFARAYSMLTTFSKEWRTGQCSAPQTGRITKTCRQRWLPWSAPQSPRSVPALMALLKKKMAAAQEGEGRGLQAQTDKACRCISRRLNILPRSWLIGWKWRSLTTVLKPCKVQIVRLPKTTEPVDVNVRKLKRLLNVLKLFTNISKGESPQDVQDLQHIGQHQNTTTRRRFGMVLPRLPQGKALKSIVFVTCTICRKSGEWHLWSSETENGGLQEGRKQRNWIEKFSPILQDVRMNWA